ncbi:MAG TPA: polyphosphate polymerase domain-containing protein [Bacillota bacterium]|nr:polyphosphate polymerase domain-containing protein [Bacillota bacterium]
MAIEIFRRREQKYLITTKQYDRLIDAISEYMRPDTFGENGHYTVTSLYFDSADHRIYFETKNKLKFRQKLRLRIYNETNVNGTAFFEVKQKHKKVVNKRRMLLPLSGAYHYLRNDGHTPLEYYETSNPQIFREIDYFRRLYKLKPEMVVSYDRHALHGIDDAELRMTFDRNLRCRNEDLSIENGPYGAHFIDLNLIVLEVKVNDSVPLWLTRILQDLHCEQRGASKFCTSKELLHGTELPNGVGEELVSV